MLNTHTKHHYNVNSHLLRYIWKVLTVYQNEHFRKQAQHVYCPTEWPQIPYDANSNLSVDTPLHFQHRF